MTQQAVISQDDNLLDGSKVTGEVGSNSLQEMSGGGLDGMGGLKPGELVKSRATPLSITPTKHSASLMGEDDTDHAAKRQKTPAVAKITPDPATMS